MPGYSGVPVVTTLVCSLHFAREAVGAAGTRHSLRPLFIEGHCLAKLGRLAPRERGVVSGFDVIARSQRVPPSAGPMINSATKQSTLLYLRRQQWIASRSPSSRALARNDGLGGGSPDPSCPRLSRASTACFPLRCQAWMAGTSPAMTAEPGYWTISLRQQHRVRAVHGFGAVHHRLLQRCGLHRNIFGKEPRTRVIAHRISACFAATPRV